MHSNSTLISVGSEVWEGNKAQAAAFVWWVISAKMN